MKRINTFIRETAIEAYYLFIVSLPYILWIFAIIGLLSLISCKKEERIQNTPQCDCYEVHQEFIPNLGWAHDFNTDTIKMNCNSETTVWTYTNAEQTRRKNINCL
jgi:hypothetical protein